MTLLIGTVSKSNVVLTADGLSRVNPNTGAGISTDSFQKIFPVTDAPVAILHHGLNILGGRNVSLFVDDFIKEFKGLASASIEEIAAELRSFGEMSVQRALADPSNEGGVGFWVTGFGNRKARPELYEIFWPDSPDPKPHEGLVLGGDGKKFVKRFLSNPLGPFRPEKIRECLTTYARQYHQAIYRQAEAKQEKTGESIFGGKLHQLVVERKGWHWTAQQ